MKCVQPILSLLHTSGSVWNIPDVLSKSRDSFLHVQNIFNNYYLSFKIWRPVKIFVCSGSCLEMSTHPFTLSSLDFSLYEKGVCPVTSSPTINLQHSGTALPQACNGLCPKHISSAPSFQSKARDEAWGLEVQHTREIEPWRSGSRLVLHFCLFLPSCFAFSFWTGTFYI